METAQGSWIFRRCPSLKTGTTRDYHFSSSYRILFITKYYCYYYYYYYACHPTQRTAWASTLITHKHSRQKKHTEGIKKTYAQSRTPSSTYFWLELYVPGTPFAVLAPSLWRVLTLSRIQAPSPLLWLRLPSGNEQIELQRWSLININIPDRIKPLYEWNMAPPSAQSAWSVSHPFVTLVGNYRAKSEWLG